MSRPESCDLEDPAGASEGETVLCGGLDMADS